MTPLIVLGLAMATLVLAFSTYGFAQMWLLIRETEQQVFDRRFAEIVSRFDA